MAVPVLLNRGGGALAADPKLAERAAEALRSTGLDVEVEQVSGSDCEIRCRAIAERGDPLLIVGGGDGTISAAASALAGAETALGILPLGTLNHFARDLGIPSDLDEAAKLIADGKQRKVDIGEMGDRVFINNSAIGLYPLMVVDRDQQRKRLGRSKRLAMIVASLRTLIRFNHHRLTLTVNNPDAGNAVEELDVDYDAAPLDIGFNARYLLDIASQLEGDTALFKLADPGSPTLIQDREGASTLYVLMPMRV